MIVTTLGVSVASGAVLDVPCNLDLSEVLDWLDPFLEDGGAFVPAYQQPSGTTLNSMWYGDDNKRIGFVR